jgi:hypothetical protein
MVDVMPTPLAGDLGGGAPAQFRVRPDRVVVMLPCRPAALGACRTDPGLGLWDELNAIAGRARPSSGNTTTGGIIETRD